MELNRAFFFDEANGLDEIIESLKTHGVAIVENYLANESLKSITEDYEAFVASEVDNTYLKVLDYSAGIGRKLIYKNLDSKLATKTVFGSKFFMDVAVGYLGEDFDLNKEIFVVEDVPASEHVAQQLHYDIARTLKFFIYLEDTSVENGAFYCVPGSHKWTAERRVEFSDQIIPGNRDFTRDLTDEYGAAIPIEGTAGTLIIFDTDVFHKAGKVSNGRRRVMRGHTRTLREMNEQKQRFEAVNKKSLLQRIISRLS